MNFFDSHCHFDFVEFDEDRKAVWETCQSLGVTGLVIPGVSPEQWKKAVMIAEAHSGIYYGVGLHPWFIKDIGNLDALQNDEAQTASLCEQIRQQLIISAQQPKCVAIGECGLDALIETPLPLQQLILDVHLQVANELSMPIIIHCRKAHNEMLKCLGAQKIKAGGVIHAFSGSIDLAKQYWALGFYLGIGGSITYERANKTRQTVRQLPLEALLLETDAPDMPLNGKQGQRNSPTNIPEVAQVLADIRGDSLMHIAQQTNANVQKLFF
jgi:TatD DNase family protein